jgi:hypothetical protein
MTAEKVGIGDPAAEITDIAGKWPIASPVR